MAPGRASNGPRAGGCASGKDRMSLLAALVLSLLDVPEQAIVEEFPSRNGPPRAYSPTHGNAIRAVPLPGRPGARPRRRRPGDRREQGPRRTAGGPVPQNFSASALHTDDLSELGHGGRVRLMIGSTCKTSAWRPSG
ncbi:tyrosine-protein phosphatase [Streptomyces sp. NPDC005917]|uniref:tyrosine-protein phosphatase n=1 Tax=unclassified Streptomyces TaxID=2593676 RepID=UPI0033F89A23